MKRSLYVIAALAFVATAALAHNGVKTPAVMARMEAMSAIAKNMKTLGEFAKGAAPFSATQAQTAASAIAQHASQTETLFRNQETDPKSEALPAIWQNFADFTAKANELQNLATTYSTALQTLDDLKPAMGALGATCKSCHSDYRKK